MLNPMTGHGHTTKVKRTHTWRKQLEETSQSRKVINQMEYLSTPLEYCLRAARRSRKSRKRK